MAAMSNSRTTLAVKINVNQNIDDLNISSFKFIDTEKTINIFSNRLNNENKYIYINHLALTFIICCFKARTYIEDRERNKNMSQ